MVELSAVTLRNGVEITQDHVLIAIETMDESELAPDIEAGTVLTIDCILFDDDQYQSGFVIVVTEDHGWIHCHGLADLMDEDKVLAAMR